MNIGGDFVEWQTYQAITEKYIFYVVLKTRNKHNKQGATHH